MLALITKTEKILKPNNFKTNILKNKILINILNQLGIFFFY